MAGTSACIMEASLPPHLSSHDKAAVGRSFWSLPPAGSRFHQLEVVSADQAQTQIRSHRNDGRASDPAGLPPPLGSEPGRTGQLGSCVPGDGRTEKSRSVAHSSPHPRCACEISS